MFQWDKGKDMERKKFSANKTDENNQMDKHKREKYWTIQECLNLVSLEAQRKDWWGKIVMKNNG